MKVEAQLHPPTAPHYPHKTVAIFAQTLDLAVSQVHRHPERERKQVSEIMRLFPEQEGSNLFFVCLS